MYKLLNKMGPKSLTNFLHKSEVREHMQASQYFKQSLFATTAYQ